MKKLSMTLIAGVVGVACNSFAAEPPNVIVIFVDDMGYQDVGVFGSPNIKTPHVDQMAKEGMRFTDFYVAAPVCSASRAALLTGCYPERVGVNGAIFPNGESEGLDPKYVTMAEMLKGAGYVTKAVGKWHLGDEKKFLPTRQGFDSYYGIPYSNDMFPAKGMTYATDCLYRDGVTPESIATSFPPVKEGQSRWEKQPHIFKNKVPLMRDEVCIEFPVDQSTLTQRYTEEAVAFIEKNQSQPFFLYLAHSMPHVPLYASPEFEGKSEAGLYGDCVEEIDWSVGRIFKTLRKNGLDRNTVVFFSSDNGPWYFKENATDKVRGNMNRQIGGSALPLSGYKFTNLEGGMRVPSIMWGPGRVAAGKTCSEVASTIDMLPTFAALSGAVLPESRIDGKNILPLLEGNKLTKSPHEAFFYGTVGVRAGRWKAIYSKESKTYELYDLETDISESHDVAKANPEIIARLKRLVEEHKSDVKKQ